MRADLHGNQVRVNALITLYLLPLVTHPERVQIPDAVKTLYTLNLISNPVTQSYLTLMERPNPRSRLPVLPASAIADIVTIPMARNPTLQQQQGHRATQGVIAMAVPAFPALPPKPADQQSFNVGIITARPAPGSPLHLCERQFLVDLHGQELQPRADAYPVSVETAVFPHLFPNGTGNFTGKGPNKNSTFIEYLNLRASSAFSPYTMYPPYTLAMHQVRRLHSPSPAACLLSSFYAPAAPLQLAPARWVHAVLNAPVHSFACACAGQGGTPAGCSHAPERGGAQAHPVPGGSPGVGHEGRCTPRAQVLRA